MNEKILNSIIEEQKKTNKLLTDLLNFFYSIEEMNLGEDSKYEEELTRDRFHPPIA